MQEQTFKLAMQLGRRLLNSQLHQTFSSANQCLPTAYARFSTAASDSDGIVKLAAQIRSDSGTLAANKLRKAGKTPGTLFSLPGEKSLLLSFDSKALGNIVHQLGRTGWACTVFDVQIEDSATTPTTYRALGRQVHIASDTDLIENVTLMHCEPDRRVAVEVPLEVFGEEVSPGIKAGGRINWIKRKIPCIARGDSIPPKFEVDISKLAMNDKLYYSDIQPLLPEGVVLAIKDYTEPIIKIRK